MPSRPLLVLKTGSLLARFVPLPVLRRVCEYMGGLVPVVFPKLGQDLADNIRHVRPAAGSSEIKSLTRLALASYARYWGESFRLPYLDRSALDKSFAVEGRQYLDVALADGPGPILVIPHLGGWEWAAAWFSQFGDTGVSAVVEKLEPVDVFEWFKSQREAYGVDVIALEQGAMGPLLEVIKSGQVLCLLADRDVAGTGVEVNFFGQRTSLPAGPALLARRSGATILPTAVYFTKNGVVCRIGPPIAMDRSLPLRRALQETTQQVAHALEALIEAAPEQWHVLQPIWSDITASAR